jgi:4-amino-4-deoxy-L-arabinose transferase-like glycosyltransferase
MTPDWRADRGLGLTVLLFLAVNLAMAVATGPRLGGDSPMYIDGAAALLEREPLTGRQPSYAGYIAVVAAVQAAGLGLEGLVALQVLAALAAAAAVYRIAIDLGGRAAGLLAVVLLAIDVETNRWHAYVLSDSLYASLLAGATWLTYVAGRDTSRRGGRVALAAGLLVLAGVVRPEGWFVVPAAAVYWILSFTRKTRWRTLGIATVVAASAALALMVAPRVSGNLQAVGPGEMLRAGQTIWDDDEWRLSMPEGPPVEPGESSATTAIRYALHQPADTAVLMLARVGVHVIHVRPFYSMAHNAVTVAWLLPVYLLGAVALWRLAASPLVRWVAAVLASQTLVVALTHADWDGRYLAHVLALWYPLTACGAVMVWPRWRPWAGRAEA